MTQDRRRKIDDVYHAALACDPEMRLAFTAEACEGDEELRREV